MAYRYVIETISFHLGKQYQLEEKVLGIEEEKTLIRKVTAKKQEAAVLYAHIALPLDMLNESAKFGNDSEEGIVS